MGERKLHAAFAWVKNPLTCALCGYPYMRDIKDAEVVLRGYMADRYKISEDKVGIFDMTVTELPDSFNDLIRAKIILEV